MPIPTRRFRTSTLGGDQTRKLQDTMPVVLGGGLSGLAAAYYLTQRFINPVILFESSKRVGGWIRTENHEEKGFLFEVGPRTIRPKGPAAANTLALLEHIGLKDLIHPIYSTHPAAKNRMIYVRKKLFNLPSDIGGIFKTMPPFSKPLISGLFHDLRAPSVKQRMDDESIYGFVERRFGPEIAEYAISPMICGICAGDAKEISVRLLMNDVFEREQKFGGVIKGLIMSKLFGKKTPENKYAKTAESSDLAKTAKSEKWSIYTLKGGLEMLPKTLLSTLQSEGVDVRTSKECKKISFGENAALLNINGVQFQTDYVISSLPAHSLAKLVEDQHPTLSSQLKTIPYVDVAVVNLQFNSAGLLPYEAFGFLVPPAEKLPILGVIFDSCCIDTPGNTIITVMMGGKWFRDNFATEPTQSELLEKALTHVRTILGIRVQPKLARVNILRNCIPQYTVGHKKRVERIRSYISKYKLPLSVCGAAYDGVGVNDVILSAKTQVFSCLDNMEP